MTVVKEEEYQVEVTNRTVVVHTVCSGAAGSSETIVIVVRVGMERLSGISNSNDCEHYPQYYMPYFVADIHFAAQRYK